MSEISSEQATVATGDDSLPAAPEPHHDRGGARIGPFEIRRRCGEGGMGVVYAAIDTRDGAPVALKVLRTELAGRSHSAAIRFAAEAEVLASLAHPAIVRHVAHGTTPEGDPFLAMEWLEGEDLAKRLEQGALDVRETAALGRRVAEALAAAHALGVIHRDIKPGNLFLPGGDVEQVKVLDFGIARIDRAPRALTATGAVLGTVGYMAPEQARAAGDIDGRPDVFALGAVLFECLTGRPAFAGQQVMAVLAKLLLEDPPRLGTLGLDVPAALDDLVARMLAKGPSLRPEGAAAVAAELAAMHLDEPGPAAPARPSRPPPAALTGGEQRFLCVVFVGVAGLDAPGAGPADPTLLDLSASVAGQGGSLIEALEAAAAPLGAQLVRLLDGSMVATLRGEGSAADQAARAARCALRFRAILPGVPLGVATGLGDASGRVPVGPVLDRAAGLVQAAARGEAGARVDEVTAGLLDVRFVVRAGAAGLELLEERDAAEGVRLLLGRPSPCVGRERELQTLGALLDECVSEGVARAVLVTSPAGGGKSRILHELLHGARRRSDGVEVWLGRGDPLSAGSAFALLASALRGAAGMAEGEPLEARRRKLDERVGRHVAGKDRARVAAFLGEMAGTPFPDGESALLRSARANPTIMAEQVRRAFEDFTAAECAAHPLLLAFEDLHWGDLPSVKLVDAALDKLKERPLLVVALGRPEVRELFPGLWAERGAQEIRLGELTRRAAERLVRHALGGGVEDETVARIVARAGGNAFYLEELIRAVAEGRGDDLPETVLAMVEARLDALDPDDRRVLRAASVFGEALWRGGVLALLGAAERATRAEDRLAALVEREVFVRRDESRFPGEDELVFRHALLRDGAYAMLTEGDRALGHRLAGAWLEAHGEGDPLVLARHFERGGEPARAEVHYLRAAQQAYAGNDFLAAIARAEQGLARVTSEERRLELLAVYAHALFSLGDLDRFAVQVAELLRLAPPGSRAFCLALAGKLTVGQQRGRPQEILEVMAALGDVPPSADNLAPLLQLSWILATTLLGVGCYELAAGIFARVEQAAALAGSDRAVEGYVAAVRAQRALAFEGDPWKAALGFAQSMECLDEVGDMIVVAFLRVYVGAAWATLGAYDQAEAAFGIAITKRRGVEAWFARVQLAITLAERGRLDEAVTALEGALGEVVAAADPARENTARTALAVVLQRRGDAAAAARMAEAALDLPPMYPRHRDLTLAVLAAARLAQGRAPEALRAVREAMSGEEPPAVRAMFEPFIRLVYVEALDVAGDHEGARAALAIARDRLLATAAKIGDPALRRSFLEDVADNARTLALAAERLGPA